MAYSIHYRNKFWRTGEIQKAISEQCPETQETMNRLCLLEELEARGEQYNNQAFDVLSLALSYLERNSAEQAAGT